MKILCITPGNDNTITPETGMAKLLTYGGHDIFLQYTDYKLKNVNIMREALDFNPDVIHLMNLVNFFLSKI